MVEICFYYHSSAAHDYEWKNIFIIFNAENLKCFWIITRLTIISSPSQFLLWFLRFFLQKYPTEAYFHPRYILALEKFLAPSHCVNYTLLKLFEINWLFKENAKAFQVFVEVLNIHLISSQLSHCCLLIFLPSQYFCKTLLVEALQRMNLLDWYFWRVDKSGVGTWRF